MIKRIFLMLLFIISTVNINYAQHMKFNGISMGETPTVFINKLKAKGFTPSYYSDNILTGTFCSWSNCTIVVTIKRNTICGTTVIFPQSEKWKYLGNRYNCFKSILIQKSPADIRPAKNVLSLSDQATHCITLNICRSEESRRLIAGIESDKASHKTDHDI